MADGTIEQHRLIFPGLAGLYAGLSPYSYTIIRVGLGGILLSHGIDKLFFGDAATTVPNFVRLGLPAPLAWAWFIGFVEAIGGLLLVLGLLTRLAALAFIIEMAVISFALLSPHWWWGGHGMEFTVLMGIIAIAIFFRGGGPVALDNSIGREL